MLPSRLTLCTLCVGFGSVACGVVYPEVQTPLRTPPTGYTLAPPPPDDLIYLRFDGADIPSRTLDGRKWDALGGAAPDPFAKIMVHGKEIIVTPVQSDTLSPTWPDQLRANYRIRPGTGVHVEIWDKNPINSRPICAEDIADLHDHVSLEHPFEVSCESGARFRLVIEPAHGRLGLGFYYELHTDSAYVTRVLEESPARRAGLATGDEITKVQGRDVATMEQGELQSLINANGSTGIEMTLRNADGGSRTVKVQEGGIYPIVGEPVDIQ